MKELIVITDRCSNCGAALPADAVGDRCASCRAPETSLIAAGGSQAAGGAPEGQLVSSGAVEAVPAPRSGPATIALSGPVAAVLNSRLLVVTILLVAGPIGLPALWLSPRFSRVTKAVTTIGFFLLTVVLPLTGAWYVCEVLLRPLADAIKQANGPH
jgi:hypothetical protein